MSGKTPGVNITILSALSESNRMHIVELLRQGPLTVGKIADQFGLRQPQTSKHLKVLSDNGIVEVQAKLTIESTISDLSHSKRWIVRYSHSRV